MGFLERKVNPDVETSSIAPSEATLVNPSDPNEKLTQIVNIKVGSLLDEKELDRYLERTSKKAKTSQLDKLFGSKKAVTIHDPVKAVKMTRNEYLTYWARDESGSYVGTEPEEAGREIWRRKLWAELCLPPPAAGLDVSGFTGKNAKPQDFTGAREEGLGWIGGSR